MAMLNCFSTSGTSDPKKDQPAMNTQLQRKKRQRGSQTIEGGLVCLILFSLILLVLDLSLSIFVKSTLTTAARDGVRFAVTGQLLPGDAYLNDSVTKVVQNSAMGFLNGSNNACLVSVTYFDPSGKVTTSPTPGNVVQVSVQGYAYTPLGALFKSGSPVPITTEASDVLEACPVGGCPAAVNPQPASCP
jgi:Flp pilus assembly protein TadG